jgi:hypothetical protein
MAHQHARIGFDCHRQEIDEMLARRRPGGFVDFLDASAGKPQRIDEERPDAAAGIELQGGKAFGAGDPRRSTALWIFGTHSAAALR